MRTAVINNGAITLEMARFVNNALPRFLIGLRLLCAIKVSFRSFNMTCCETTKIRHQNFTFSSAFHAVSLNLRTFPGTRVLTISESLLIRPYAKPWSGFRIVEACSQHITVLNGTELQFANFSGIRVLRTNRALTVPVSLQPISVVVTRRVTNERVVRQFSSCAAN